MIKKPIFTIVLFFLVSVTAFLGVANAYWIWTPETKKFVNPKYAVKDSPKEQFDWGMSFYNAKDFQRAATEFEKLAKQYEFSEYASKSQYYVGLCYENMNKYYLAYQNYQKAIDNFPHIANTEEILAREFAIGNLYLSKPGPKVLGTDIMAPLDRAVEIFKKVVENAPYGKFAEDAQFKLGEALKKSERYEEAVQAFHKIVEDYPKSKLATQAMYEESQCAYKASLKPAYDAAATDNAIKTFEKFVDKNKDTDLAKNADTTMKRLKDNVAEKSFKAAEFYEAQGKTQAAIIYYQDVIDTYPDSIFVSKARAKIEALKNKGTKKAAAPIDLDKKKPKQVAKEKKPWSPLKFTSDKTEKKTEAATSETPKKKGWNPFSFNIGKKKAETATQTTQPPQSETPKKNPWNLFNLGAKKEPVVKDTPKKKAWKPLSFDTVKKDEPKKEPVVETPVAEETMATQAKGEVVEAPKVESPAEPVETLAVETPAVETPKAETPKAETPAVETRAVEAPVVEVPKAEETTTQVQDTPKKKTWKPFSFDTTKKEPVAKETPKKKAWKPLSFDTVKKDEPKTVEAPKTEEVVTQVRDAPKEKKAWKPFNFDTKKEPVDKEAQKSKGWKPLYFGTNDEPMAATNRRW